MAGLVEILLPAADQPAFLGTVRHNLMVRDKQMENDARTALGKGQRQHYAMIFASVLAAALRPHAELLLNELQDSCALVGITGQHDGYAMLKAMRLKAALPSVIQDLSARFHESAWESMRDSPTALRRGQKYQFDLSTLFGHPEGP
jgi:hypothetical protein